MRILLNFDQISLSLLRNSSGDTLDAQQGVDLDPAYRAKVSTFTADISLADLLKVFVGMTSFNIEVVFGL